MFRAVPTACSKNSRRGSVTLAVVVASQSQWEYSSILAAVAITGPVDPGPRVPSWCFMAGEYVKSMETFS
jgi:hypothetical protein